MEKENLISTAFRAGFIGVLGKPNVGKSTLINVLVGHKIAAVSPRPQTTRKRQTGILNLQEPPAQMIFIDTPGYHQARHKLGELMNQETLQILDESDVLLLVVDLSQPPDSQDSLLFDLLNRSAVNLPLYLVLNKTDLVQGDEMDERSSVFHARIPRSAPLAVSATRGDGLAELVQAVLESLPEGEPYFPEDQLTDLYERDLAADLIREAALKVLREEVPHGIAVRIDQYTERAETGLYIEATLFLERESHKPIVIGQGGKMLKAIGSTARREIEAMSHRKAYLALKVKVRPNWRDDPEILRRFGFR